VMLSLVFLGFIAANSRMKVNDTVGEPMELWHARRSHHSVKEMLWCLLLRLQFLHCGSSASRCVIS
jgi:hypothetical protein